MEAVVTLRQDPTRFAQFELRQADRAFRRVFRVCLGVVSEHGQRGEDSGVEAAGDRGGGGSGAGEHELRTAELAVAAELAAARASEVPARVDVETEH